METLPIPPSPCLSDWLGQIPEFNCLQVKQWSSHLLHQLLPLQAAAGHHPTPATHQQDHSHSSCWPMWHGELCLLERSGDLLQGWQLPLSSSPAAADKKTLASSSSACWLRSLAQHLQHLRCAAQQHPLHAASSSRSSALFTSLEPSKEVLPGRQQPQDAASNTGLGPAAEAALCALLQHPDPSCRALAAGAARQLALLCPLAALRLLPTLLNSMSKGRMELQRRVDSGLLALQKNAAKEGAGKAGEATALWALLQVSRGRQPHLCVCAGDLGRAAATCAG